MEAKRKLKNISISFISLVNKGANMKSIIYKSDNKTDDSYFKLFQIQKLDEDQKIIYGIVYSPDEVDSQGDFASAEDIQKMAYRFMKEAKTNNVDKQHNFIPGEGFIAESWILQENDPVFPDIAKGSWAVAIKIEKDETWQKIKEGEITGLSMAGDAEAESLKKNAPPENPGIIAKFRELLGLDNSPVQKQDFLSQQITSKMDELIELVKSLKTIEPQEPENEKSFFAKLEELENSYSKLLTRIDKLEKCTVGSKQSINQTQNNPSIWI
jgi:hypothetical protein